MKNNLIFLLLLAFPICSCGPNDEAIKDPVSVKIDLNSIDIPEISLEKSSLNYNAKNSLWTSEGKRFSGYAVSYYQDSTLRQKIGILDGKKQNESFDWYSDGHVKQLAKYYKGKLEGEKKMWSPDSTHILVSHLNYHLGKLHGTQKKWYPTGEIFKILNLANGKEEGIQQAYRKNGNLFANYEAREGRIFGLKRAALCFGLEDEKIQYEK